MGFSNQPEMGLKGWRNQGCLKLEFEGAIDWAGDIERTRHISRKNNVVNASWNLHLFWLGLA